MTDQITLTAREYADKFDMFMATGMIVAQNYAIGNNPLTLIGRGQEYAEKCMAARGYTVAPDGSRI